MDTYKNKHIENIQNNLFGKREHVNEWRIKHLENYKETRMRQNIEHVKLSKMSKYRKMVP